MRLNLLVIFHFLSHAFVFPQSVFLTTFSGTTCYNVLSYNLDLDIDIKKRYIKGSNTIHYKTEDDFIQIKINLFKNLSIDSIVFKNQKLTFSHDSNEVTINFSSLQKKGGKGSFIIYYQGQPHEARNAPWDGGFVWRKDTLGNPWVGVACQNEGGSLWWPCKNPLYDKPDFATMSFTIPDSLFCVSNGNLIKETPVGNARKKFTWAVSYPINHYNITLNIGKYSHFSEPYKREDSCAFPLDYYVLTYNLDKAKEHFKQVPKILKAYEHFFGPYPFERDGYALVETPYWGMEHQSCIAYGNDYKNELIDFDFIIVHETAHEWWGNSVTAYTSQELWIHESFGTYAESLLLEYYYGKEAAIQYMEKQKTKIKNKQPLFRDDNYFVIEDTDIYYKGSWMLHTLRHVIKDDNSWFNILYKLNEAYKYKLISTGGVILYFEDAKKSNVELYPIFSIYISNTVIPMFCYYVKKEKSGTFLYYKWNTTNQDFIMPVHLQLKNKKELRLISSAEFQKIKIKASQAKDIRVMTELFYVDYKDLSDKK
ncbi:MAG: M1 family metallopeptidase [Cytophagaceae bacterium]|nr:M1 family metallopeptidase [Cytophagaceae bacterium]